MESLAVQFHKFHDKTRPIIATSLYGLVASLAAVAFQVSINWVYLFCLKKPSTLGFWHFAGISFLVVAVSSLIAGWLLSSYCPEAAGSGIPQVKLSFWKEFGYAPMRIAVIKFVAGVISIGGGQSLGREGPTVQIGANLASSLGGLLGVSKQNRRGASAAGAAAGLAAAFNAPLAAIAFVLEEIIGDLNSRFLGAVLLASVIGAFVVHGFIGPQPAFILPEIKEPTWRSYLLMPVAAAFSAAIGVVFQRWSMALRAWSRGLKSPPRWLHPFLGGMITWVIGVSVFAYSGRLGIFALGYEDLSDALVNGMAWKLAAIFLIGKLLVTVASYGFGGCGGIFSPNLFLGGMCGIVVAGVGSDFMALHPADVLLLAVGGMSACLGAVVQAPVTAILIIFEMTHTFALVPGLMLAGLVSQAIARSLNPANFYEELLVQDGHNMEHLIPPRDLRSWQNLPISAIANFKPSLIEDTSETALAERLESHPYRNFPVVEDGFLKGIVSRAEIEAALREHRPLTMEAAPTCNPAQRIRDCQDLFIQSATGVILITSPPPGNKVLALVTLHDVLRAQLAMSERENNI